MHSLKIKRLFAQRRVRCMERWNGRECGGIRREMLDKQTRVTSKKSSPREKKRKRWKTFQEGEGARRRDAK